MLGNRFRYRICSLIILLLLVGLAFWINVNTVFAEEVTVHFGSEGYTATEGTNFPVGVYINSQTGIGSYAVALTYDPATMTYIDGADAVDAEKGILYFVGDSSGPEKKYMVHFNLASPNNTSISIAAAKIKSAETGEDINAVIQGTAPITAKPKQEETPTEETPTEETPAEEVTEEPAEPEESEEVLAEETQKDVAEESENKEEIKTVVAENKEATEEEAKVEKTSILYNSYFLIGVIFVGVIIFVQILLAFIDFIFKKREKRLAASHFQDKLQVMDLEEDAAMTEAVDNEPVISVDDVTMEFHIASTQTSGLKDYIIQFLKRQITYKKLYALYHVSFNVYRGEIVGIIGTNGSGKSTLLKIVSGALRPTEGEVKADRKKIQLLTLGTGFDMELTGKENVYLNGAIIGYSKKFLDEHYDEIVEFAELQDFMDEKVKNYSSGMVSRLGFAIATAGDAAEILILDEVLSVGDEFFRKKSLKRVKEMIHGGSTVLLVSHSMETIIDNCSKCVWIEKGELKMVDEPKVVCAAYRKMKEQEAG